MSFVIDGVKMKKSGLLSGVAAFALLSFGAPVSAQQANSQQVAAAEEPGVVSEEIVVYGQGETRQVQTLGEIDIQAAIPGTSPIAIVQKLPGVNYQAADPFGAYEWAVRISVRGFNQNQLGFTLDGIPLGDMSYGNHNGLHISRAISTENLGAVELAQGSGALDTASTSNLGGTLQFNTRKPSETFGVFTQITAGTDDTIRPFIRMDTGQIGPNGPRAFVSYAYSTADKWKGDGKHTSDHVNTKISQPILGGEGEIAAFFSYSDRRESDYQDLSLDVIRRLGYKLDNISDNYALAQQIARAYQTNRPIPAPYATVDDVYYDAAGLRKDKFGYITAHVPIEMITADVAVYGHGNLGQGSWITPYTVSPNGSPLAFRTTEYDIARRGGKASLTGEFGGHELNGGVWFEKIDYDQARRFYQMGLTQPERSARDFQGNPFFTQWEYDIDTKTNVLHLQDTYKGDFFTLNAGFKSMESKNTATPVVGTIAGTIRAEDHFLPQAGATFDVADGHQLFASYAENMRAFIGAATGAAPFSTTQAGFNAIVNTLKPEKSRTLETGWRFNMDAVSGVLAVYDVKFKDRLLAIASGPGIVGGPSVLANVGNVKSRGVELGGTVELVQDFSLFGSFAYNDAEYKNDIVDGNGVRTAIAGKRVVDAPKILAKAELAYDNGDFFAKVGASHTGKRYYTYLNDQSVKDYTLVDLTAGYRFGSSMGIAEGWEIQGNIANLFDKKYVSSIGTNGFANSDPTGTFATLMAGSPFQAFVTLRAQF
jgi:iron complex outermembrane receptor protein